MIIKENVSIFFRHLETIAYTEKISQMQTDFLQTNNKLFLQKVSKNQGISIKEEISTQLEKDNKSIKNEDEYNDSIIYYEWMDFCKEQDDQLGFDIQNFSNDDNYDY